MSNYACRSFEICEISQVLQALKSCNINIYIWNERNKSWSKFIYYVYRPGGGGAKETTKICTPPASWSIFEAVSSWLRNRSTNKSAVMFSLLLLSCLVSLSGVPGSAPRVFEALGEPVNVRFYRDLSLLRC
jgi:hypothetical protein